MVRSIGRSGITKVSETPAELIQDYVDFLNPQPVLASSSAPAFVGFQLTQHVPAEYGPGATEKKPEIIYSWGTLHRVGTHSLVRYHRSVAAFCVESHAGKDPIKSVTE